MNLSKLDWRLGLLAGLLVSSVAIAAPPRKTASLEQRLDRIEKMTSSRALLDMSNQLQLLQSEIRQLRGQVEEMGFELDRLKNKPQGSSESESASNESAELRLLLNEMNLRLNRLEYLERTPQESAESSPLFVPVTSSATDAPTTAEAPELTKPTETILDNEVSIYKSAFEHLKEGRYADAELDFKLYLERYPEGEYADNAQYWLGESAYVVRDFVRARAEFDILLKQYPNSAKIPDTWLKLGFISYEEEDYPKARDYLEAVRTNYSASHAASLARQRLERMTSEGR